LEAGVVEERVGAGVGGPGGVGEVLGEFAGGVVVDDVAERVPPPGRFLRRDLLRVEHPHLVVAFAQAAGRVEDVAFVGGDDHRAGGIGDGRYGQRGGLAGPGAGDVDDHVLVSRTRRRRRQRSGRGTLRECQR
jgi:hypothetical protein